VFCAEAKRLATTSTKKQTKNNKNNRKEIIFRVSQTKTENNSTERFNVRNGTSQTIISSNCNDLGTLVAVYNQTFQSGAQPGLC